MVLTNARILILDEPTAVLTNLESENVLILIRKMALAGCAVILITHKLREVLQYSDRVTVMRGGKTVLSQKQTSEVTREQLAKAMVGESAEQVRMQTRELGESRYVIEGVKVRNQSGGIGVDDVSLNIRAGEIHGVAGVGGNGQSQLSNALMGLMPIEEGKCNYRRRKHYSHRCQGTARSRVAIHSFGPLRKWLESQTSRYMKTMASRES